MLALFLSFHFNLNAFADTADKNNSQEQLQILRQKQQTVNDLYHQAKSAYAEQNFDQAENLFNQILKIDPLHRSAAIYLDQYIPNKKQQLKEAAQREKERQQRIAQEKAEREARQKRLAAERKAREKQQAAERAKQEKINNFYNQAKVAYSEENFDQAENLFKQVLEIDPEHSGAETYLNNYIPNKKQQLKAAAQREKERQQR
ncbi:MAG: hypothetical protein K9M00_03715, partial [Candidatus Omnitrophica bacterium]|nr:hypothetical protein [Candidatus Omnitrophota bacterium]